MKLIEKIKHAPNIKEFNEAVIAYAKLIGFKQGAKENSLHEIYLALNISFKDGFFIQGDKLITEQQIVEQLQCLGLWKDGDLNTMVNAFIRKLNKDANIRTLWLNNVTTSITKPNALYKALITKDIETLLVAMIQSKIEYFVFLYGVGKAGKSIIARIMANVFKGYTGVSTLNQLQSTFGLQSVFGKLFMYGDDLGDESLSDAGTIKSATSGDSISVNMKYKPQITVSPVANIMFGTNLIPYLDLRDDGVLRRLQILPFTTKLDVNIFNDDDDTLQSMINECSEYLIHLAKTTKVTRKQLTELNEKSTQYYYDNSVYKVEIDGTKQLTALYDDYVIQCKQDGRKAINRQKFEHITKLFNDITSITDFAPGTTTTTTTTTTDTNNVFDTFGF